MKHAKVTTVTSDGDSKTIKTDSYYEQLAVSVVEVEKTMVTTQETVNDDVKHLLGKLDEGAPQLVLTITQKNNRPDKIKYKWVEIKQNYGRR